MKKIVSLNFLKQWRWIEIVLFVTTLHAEVPRIKISLGAPRTLSYQGILTDAEGNVVADGEYSLTFSLYNVTEKGTALWSEKQTVVVEKGIFNVILGNTVLLDLAFNEPYWLGIKNGEGPELVPRIPLTSTAYSFRALNADNVNGITASLTPLANSLYPLGPDGKFPRSVLPEELAGGALVSVDGVSNNGGNVDLVPGSNIKITPNDAANTITISATGGGDISKIIAGSGLTGGGESGDVTLAIADEGVTTQMIDNGTINGIDINNVTTIHAGKLEVGIFGGSAAIMGYSTTSSGVWGASESGAGVYGYKEGGGDYAGSFYGNVRVQGTLTKTAGSFQIDHPLDPENKYLQHSFVESPDIKNVYDGVVILDSRGEAWIDLPNWFEALNKDFRYQLTPIGAPAPDLYIAEEISGNRFKIAGGTPGMKVSWQVTGIRHDPYVEAHPLQVEKEKPLQDRGKYVSPREYGKPESMGIGYEENVNIEQEIK